MNHDPAAAPVEPVGAAAGGARAGARRPRLVDASGPRAPAAGRADVRPRYRAILAVDIEGSTRRTDPVKGELRRTLYQFLEEAFWRAGIEERCREAFVDRGDGALVLVHPLDEVPKTLLLHPVVPILGDLLDEYNSALTSVPDPDRRIRVRVAVHAGEVHSDGRGNFGEALDVACRLLDAPQTKRALRGASGPLVLVVSEDIYHGIVRHGYEGISADGFLPLVRLEVTGRRLRGWVRDSPVPGSAGAGAGPGHGLRVLSPFGRPRRLLHGLRRAHRRGGRRTLEAVRY
ncbi:hypothetical protein [Actinomadura fibrosa]|uniref:Guanylate cyclase domain-containing protein n=1 Tax=Actinomadura fibrosa TaxID=111802 RepID=A0ABW2XS45_9ACTN